MPRKNTSSEGDSQESVHPEAETVSTVEASGEHHAHQAEEPHCRHEHALKIVKRNTAWAAGSGIIPVPGLDLIGIMGSQVKMLHELSKLYDVTFLENKAKNIIGVLLGSIGAVNLTLVPVASLLKLAPVVGTILGGLSMPTVAGASTYALGKVFIHHFETGGTFLDFDPNKTKESFRKQFEEGKTVAAAH